MRMLGELQRRIDSCAELPCGNVSRSFMRRGAFAAPADRAAHPRYHPRGAEGDHTSGREIDDYVFHTGQYLPNGAAFCDRAGPRHAIKTGRNGGTTKPNLHATGAGSCRSLITPAAKSNSRSSTTVLRFAAKPQT